jgi:hypothetical protein
MMIIGGYGDGDDDADDADDGGGDGDGDSEGDDDDAADEDDDDEDDDEVLSVAHLETIFYIRLYLILSHLDGAKAKWARKLAHIPEDV